MNVKLVLEKGGSRPQTFTLRGQDTIVGRRHGCDLRVPSDQVSRRHCRLSYHDDHLTVEDLASSNGTFVNGERINRPRILRPGDRLTVGSVTFVVQYQLSQGAINRMLNDPDLVQEEYSPPAPMFADDEEIVAGVPVSDDPLVPIPVDNEEAEVAIPVESAEMPQVKATPAEVALEELAQEAETIEEAPRKKAASHQKTKLPKPEDETPETKPAPKKPEKKPAEVKKAVDADDDDDQPPDASLLLGGRNWEMPDGDDIRDILGGLEKES